MANKANEKNEFSKSGQVAEARELWGEDPSALQCSNCGATKVATSRAQSGDQMRSLLWPALPYRCLRCYHRFWLKEPFFAKKARVIFWAIAALALILVAAKAVSILLGSDKGRDLASEQEISVLVPPVDEANIGSAVTSQEMAQADLQDQLAGDADEGRLATVGLPINEVDIAEPASTIEQQKEQVRMAKERAETAARQSQEKLEQMETSLAPDPLERESLAKVEVGYAIETWRSSWESGDVQAYLRQYNPSFKPANGLTIDEWEAQRVTRVSPSKQIKLSLSAFDMSFSENFAKAQVEFQQAYSAGAYSETSTKQLELLKVAGSWKIVSENELEQ